jgi:long-chain fatty acid transport protein
MPAVAYRISEEWSGGAGINLMYTMFEQKAQINNPLPFQTEGQLEIDDDTWGIGGNLGLLFEPSARSRFGLGYLTPTKINLETRPTFTGLAPGLEAVLRSAGLIDGQIDVGMTAPQAIMFSAYHELSARVSLMGNVGWQNWSKFGKADVLVASEDPTSLTADRNYEDTWHGALGVQWRASEPWRVSLGVAYDSSVVKDEDRTPDLPLGASWRFGSGVRWQAGDSINFGAAYELLYGGNLEMDVARGPLAGRVAGTYESTAMHFINVSVNWAW